MTGDPGLPVAGDGDPGLLVAGDGARAVVFLHGIGGAKEGWRPQLDAAAAAGWCAVAWDLPGYGGTPLPAVLTWDGIADALCDRLDRLGIERTALVGHSYGGMVAQAFAAQHPDRLSALVLSGTSPAFGRADGDWQRLFLRARLAPLEAGRSMAELAPEIVAGLVGPAPDPAGLADAVACMARVPETTYRQSLALLVTFDLRAALPTIAVPTLVLAGETDSNAPLPVMARMAERIPRARFQMLPQVGHLANFEAPAAFSTAVIDFLGAAA